MFLFPSTFKWLRWRAPNLAIASLPALPDGIERFFVPTPDGRIEVLYAKPQSGSPTRTQQDPDTSPRFFVHGGMGGAWVWLEYLQFFSAPDIPCYAVSLRGHGARWHPSYLPGLLWAQEHEGGREVVLVAHSSGGGFAQFILSEGDVRVNGLVLAASVPGSGSAGVHWNWLLLDPWLTIRMIFHGCHPNSPLSHPVLIRRAFFSERLSDTYVERFQERLSPYGSFLWPLGLAKTFVNPLKMLTRITRWGNTGQKILVLCGTIDKVMTLPITESLTNTYRKAHIALVQQNKLESNDGGVQSVPGDGGQDHAGQGVRFCVVPGAAHHLQNDVTWEVGAQKLLAFYEQL